MEEEHLREVRQRVVEIQEMLHSRNMSDHDLLIRLNAISERMAADLGDVKTGVLQEISSLGTRVLALEKARWMMLGAASTLGFIASLIADIVWRH